MATLPTVNLRVKKEFPQFIVGLRVRLVYVSQLGIFTPSISKHFAGCMRQRWKIQFQTSQRLQLWIRFLSEKQKCKNFGFRPGYGCCLKGDGIWWFMMIDLCWFCFQAKDMVARVIIVVRQISTCYSSPLSSHPKPQPRCQTTLSEQSKFTTAKIRLIERTTNDFKSWNSVNFRESKYCRNLTCNSSDYVCDVLGIQNDAWKHGIMHITYITYNICMYNVKTNCPPHRSTNCGKDSAITCDREHGAYFHYQHLWISWNFIGISTSVVSYQQWNCRIVIQSFMPNDRIKFQISQESQESPGLASVIFSFMPSSRTRDRLGDVGSVSVGRRNPLQLKNQGQILKALTVSSYVFILYHCMAYCNIHVILIAIVQSERFFNRYHVVFGQLDSCRTPKASQRSCIFIATDQAPLPAILDHIFGTCPSSALYQQFCRSLRLFAGISCKMKGDTNQHQQNEMHEIS